MTWDEIKKQREGKSGVWDEIVKSRGGTPIPPSKAVAMDDQTHKQLLSGARARNPTGVPAPQPSAFSPLLQEQMAKAGTRDVEIRNKVITPTPDNSPDWMKNYQTGHPIKGTGGLVLSALNLPQSALMNSAKNVVNIAKGKPAEWKNDYSLTNYLKDVAGDNSFIEQSKKANPILGAGVQMAAEMATDPLTWIGGGFIDDIAKAGVKKVGSAAYDINKLTGKTTARAAQGTDFYVPPSGAAVTDIKQSPKLLSAPSDVSNVQKTVFNANPNKEFTNMIIPAEKAMINPTGPITPATTKTNVQTPINLIPQKITPPMAQKTNVGVFAENTDSLIAKIRTSIPDLKNDPIVSNLTGNEFPKGESKLSQQVSEFFNRFGNKVTRNGFGEVILNERGVKDSIAHGIGRDKAIAFASVPDVIKKGRLIDFQENWKGRLYDTYVFSAPVKVGEETNYVGAIVLKDKASNRYYLHEVITKKGDSLSFKTGSLPKGRLPGDNSSPLINSMLQAPQNVNANIGSVQAAPLKAVTQNVDIPKGYKERGYSESIRTKADLPEAVKQEFTDNPAFYKQLSNKTTKESADAIFAQGVPKARSDFDILLKQKDPRALPLGNSLAKEYMAQGDREGAVSVLRQMAEELTKSGQFSQAAAINLMKNDPLTAMTYIERQLDRINVEGVKKYGKRWTDFALNDSEKTLFSGAAPGDENAIKKAFETVGSRIARQYPSTIGEKIVELSRISMLLNPKTQVRNVVSNTFLLPIRQFSDKLSALGQNAYALVDPNFKPTQAFMVNKEAKALSGEVWNSVKENLLGVDKWEQDVTLGIKNKEIFKIGKLSPTRAVNAVLPKSKQLEKPIAEYMRDLTYSLLEKGDSPFVKKNFTDRLSSYIQAQGIKNFADVPQEAIDVATSEALKATFKDDNALTQVLSAMKRKTGIVGEAVMPFTKTPANIAMRGIDYSPAGIATAIHQYAKGGKNPALLIDNLSKAAVGTAGIWLGIALAKEGIITGAQNENKNIAAFDRAQGKIPYSIKAGGRYYSYDWSQPAAIPLIIGAALYDASQKQDEAVSGILNGTFNAASAAGDQFLNLSPLQNIKDIIGGYGSPSEKVMQTVAEFPQRLIPSVVGATSRIIDPKARQAYSANNFQKSQIDEYKSKLPGLSKLLPANVDVWGREINRLPVVGQRVMQEYVSPSTIGIQNITPADKEIERLYQATSDTGIIPKKAEWTREYKGLKYSLTNTEWTNYQATLGKTSKNVLDSMISLAAYKSLSDGQKSTAVQKTYDYAQEKAKVEYFNDKGVLYVAPKSVEKADGAQSAGISLADYFTAQAAISNMETDKNKNGESVSGSLKKKVVEYINGLGLSREQKKYLIEAQGYDVPLLLK